MKGLIDFVVVGFDEESAWKDIYGSRPGHSNFHKDPIHVGSIQSLPGVTTITMAVRTSTSKRIPQDLGTVNYLTK